MKNERVFYYMFIVVLAGYNDYLRFVGKLSAFLSVEVTKRVKFQIPRYKGFKVGIFSISHN